MDRSSPLPPEDSSSDMAPVFADGPGLLEEEQRNPWAQKMDRLVVEGELAKARKELARVLLLDKAQDPPPALREEFAMRLAVDRHAVAIFLLCMASGILIGLLTLFHGP